MDNKYYNPDAKFFAVMLFETKLNLEFNDAKPEEWFNYNNIFFSNGLEALTAFTEIPCPASQLIGPCETQEELLNEMINMINNFKDKNWLDQNLYPFL